MITENKISVFSATYCPYCADSKNTLQQLGHQAYVVEVDKVNGGADMDSLKDFLNKESGMRTLPKNYINGQLVGGNSDLHELV